ncbi:MAG: tryptophan 7-halogenase [Alphaproteobacteria bacterium]|nr:MAG: tryptophan 7-halogenase [Alphaproteobacteria bacterium]
MTKQINKIAVVGGGSAGWLSAAYLARYFQSSQPGSVQVTLIESSDVGTIGVGEATIPTIRKVINFFGLDEPRFMRETSATFKQAIRFDDWLHLPENGRRNSFYHAFQRPFQVKGEEAAGYWLLTREQNHKSYVDYITSQGMVCEAGRGPFVFGEAPGPQRLNYAYHFDAGRFASLLKSIGTADGVEHRIGHVSEVVVGEDGAIERLKVKDQEDLVADLFIDCSGFGAFLIEKKLGSPFLDRTDMLFCDRAVTVQIPYETPEAPVRPFTTSTAKSNGWIWDIGLVERRGIGHVYSSRHISDDEAEKTLREYAGPLSDGLNARKLEMRIGYREKPWVKNCLSIGLASGFIEPLESTGIHQVELSLSRFCHTFSRQGDMTFMASEFNKRMSAWFETTFDFIKLHYCISRRDDSDFWIENRQPETISDRLQNYLEAWRHRPMVIEDIPIHAPTFGPTSYHQILFGMEYLPDLKGQEAWFSDLDFAKLRAAQNTRKAEVDVRRLPDHRELVTAIYNS